MNEGPLTNANLSTAVIYVTDLDRMIAFYRDALGLRVEHQTEHYVELAAAGGAHLALHAGREGREAGGAPWFLEFRVEDIEETVAVLRTRAVEVGEISERAWGREVGFADPEGNRIEIEQPAGG